MQETWVQSLGWEDPLEKEMATHSSLCLGNPMDRRAWRATARGVEKESDMTEQLNNNKLIEKDAMGLGLDQVLIPHEGRAARNRIGHPNGDAINIFLCFGHFSTRKISTGRGTSV